jgi:diguanylate cyclase (GGDEF)-like protein/PAS domain S-box-containing protein
MRTLRYAINLRRYRDSHRGSQERYRLMIEHSSDILTLMRTDGTVIYESPSIQRAFGYPPSELAGKNVFDYVHPDDKAAVEQMLRQSRNDSVLGAKTEFRFRASDGSWRYLEAIGSTAVDREDGLIAVVNSRDVTDRVEFERQLISLSIEDPLTGLFNRRGFVTLGTQQIKLAKRNAQELCLLFADVDGLKAVNDRLGHAEGDRALVEVARTLRGTFREPDILARIGGDEFAVLAIGASQANMPAMIQRLRNNLAVAAKDKRYPFSLSFGVVHFDRDNPCGVDALIARADVMMYQDKLRKKARPQI